MKLEGFRDLERALAQITADATRKNIARRALKEAAAPILDAFQLRTVTLTGNLLESEVVSTRLNRRQRRLNRTMKMPVEVFVGTNDPAGVQQEFGNRFQAASPALGPAWRQEGGEVALVRIGKAMGENIDKAAARQARKAARAARKKG